MTEKGQIKGVEGRKIEVNFHYMAVLGHIILETTYFNESERFYMAENGHVKGVKSEYGRYFTVFGFFFCHFCCF